MYIILQFILCTFMVLSQFITDLIGTIFHGICLIEYQFVYSVGK